MSGSSRSNIVLIGLPASGKSTVGVILAKALGYNFIDGDLLIQAKEGKPLCEIIKEKGVDEFLRIENKVNLEIQCERTVIAPGGSIIYSEEAMQHFKEIATVIYLQMDYDIFEDRLHDPVKRGVTLEKGETLRDLYDKRVPLYEKWADLTINESGHALEDLVISIVAKIRP